MGNYYEIVPTFCLLARDYIPDQMPQLALVDHLLKCACYRYLDNRYDNQYRK